MHMSIWIKKVCEQIRWDPSIEDSYEIPPLEGSYNKTMRSFHFGGTWLEWDPFALEARGQNEILSI